MHHRLFDRLFVLALVAAAASVAAPSAALACDSVVFSCTQDDGARTIQVCNAGDRLDYTFGITGMEPMLALSEPLDAGTYQPWPGVGSSIWETVRFGQDGETHEVWSAILRGDEMAVEEGGVRVVAGEETMSEMLCDAGSVTSDFAGLSDAMYARGLCWDMGTQGWRAGGCE